MTIVYEFYVFQLEIQIQTAVVKALHQIAQGERTHGGVLMSTTRAIMHFAYARYELWALGIKYAAVLNNHMLRGPRNKTCVQSPAAARSAGAKFN